MSIFLSKADTRKLLLLHIIEESFQQQITISELKKRMEVSEFIVISAYEELKEDIKNYRLSDQIAIQKFNKILKIKRTMNFSSKSLRSIYIQRSLNFQIIEDIFEEKFSNPSDYAERFYISRTKVYTQITGIKKQLKKYELMLSSQFKILGNELTIRMYFYNLYQSCYGGQKIPFPKKIRSQIDLFLKEIQKRSAIQLSQTSIDKLRFFIGISLQRIQRKKGIKQRMTFTTIIDFKEMNQVVLEAAEKAFSDKMGASEVEILTYFILNLDEFSQFLALEKGKLDDLTDYFLTEFEASFENRMNQKLRGQITTYLRRIHYMILNFNYLQNELDQPIQARFVEENYPEVLIFCSSLIRNTPNIKKYQLIKANNIFLFNHYIFLLIDILPPSFFATPIKVCVDFSLGENYNKFITRNIQSFDFINIEVTNRLTSDTDILLCDYTINDSRNEEMQVIVWNAPPTTSDWANFGDCISTLRSEKKQEGKFEAYGVS